MKCIKKGYGEKIRIVKMVSVHADGYCTISYHEFEMKLMCYECKVEYDENYTFLVINCGCECGDWFRVCEECSHMFYRCDCGCEGNYNKCEHPPKHGNILVSIFLLFSSSMLVLLVGWGCLTPYLHVRFKKK